MGAAFLFLRVNFFRELVLDHTFDHLRIWTMWKQCEQEHIIAPFSDTKALEILKKETKNCSTRIRDQKVVSSSPVASTKNNGWCSHYPLFFYCVFCQ